MTIKQYESEALRQYRQLGAEIKELRKEVGEKVGALGPAEAKREFDNLLLRTKEFDELRARLEPRDLLLIKYGVTVINDHTVSFVLPKGCSKIEILNEVDQLVSNCGLARYTNLIEGTQLWSWGLDERFATEVDISKRLCIDGHVEGTLGKSRQEQYEFLRQKGYLVPSKEDVAVAFALHWVATGAPLFGWATKDQSQSYFSRVADGEALHFVTCLLGMNKEALQSAAISAHVPLGSTS